MVRVKDWGWLGSAMMVLFAVASGCVDEPASGEGAVVQCPAGLQACNGICVNTQSDPANCGACGQICGDGLVCSLGQCSTSCAGGLTQCGAACEDLLTSGQNCGACGNVCADGVCSNGACPAGTVGPGTGGTTSTGTGGSGTGGTGTGTGGTATGGSTTNNSGDPPGYWRYGNWQGCSWTGVDDTGAGTSIDPQDFTTRQEGDPYCASGTVGAHEEYESVALMGFNLNEDPTTADCSYDPNAAQSEGPPGVTMTGSGIAANIVKQGDDTNFTFRLQIQGPDGATNPDERWCATIAATEGKIFVPYEDFNTECWTETSGTDYDGEPISAVVFLVPGEPTAVPYSFCVNGFAPGESAEDAPDGTAEVGDQSGQVGFTEVSPDGDFDRAKVLVDGEQYIIQNNNWGDPSGTNLILDYFNNSFTVAEGSGSSPGGGAPASFPSIYIGANGETADGVYATSATDNLPRQISQISSIDTSFAWSGSTSSFNTTYDVWFANSPPTSAYEDGIDGFVMVWVHDPSGEQPIGSVQGEETIAGRTWDVWVGPRGDGPAGYNDASVVSFVARQDVSSMNFDLLDFIDAASDYGIDSSMYLTDVFFGFEIWNGGAGGGLSVDEFTCVVE